MKPLHTNVVQKSFDISAQRAGEPKDEQLRVSYGVIVEVNEDSFTARVDIFDRGGQKKRIGTGLNGQGEGAFLPLLQPITLIHREFGALRKGLIVRIFWRGKHYPGAEALVEVISDAGEEIFFSGRKRPRANELSVQPHDLFLGGVNV